MTDNHEKIYFQALTKAMEKILSKLVDKIRLIEEKISRLERIEELPKFQEVVSELRNLHQNVENLRISDKKEKESLTSQILNIQRTLLEFDKRIRQMRKEGS